MNKKYRIDLTRTECIIVESLLMPSEDGDKKDQEYLDAIVGGFNSAAKKAGVQPIEAFSVARRKALCARFRRAAP